MVQAYKLAAISCHPMNQNGAVLLSADGLRTIGQGITGTPTGMKLTDANRADEDYYEHAAIDAIHNAGLKGKLTYQAIMVCPWVASVAVARALIEIGCARLIVHAPRMQLTPGVDEIKAFDMLVEGGVRLDHIYSSVRGPNILVNGGPWSPDPVGNAFYRGNLGQTYNPTREP